MIVVARMFAMIHAAGMFVMPPAAVAPAPENAAGGRQQGEANQKQEESHAGQLATGGHRPPWGVLPKAWIAGKPVSPGRLTEFLRVGEKAVSLVAVGHEVMAARRIGLSAILQIADANG